MKGIADTGFLVAFGNRNDQHHGWAVGLARQIRQPFLTCEAVLSETAFHLGNVQLVTQYLASGLVKLDFELAIHLDRIAALARKFQDRKPDLADLCLICLSEQHPQHVVATTDAADFRLYRRHERERIPLLLPPAR